MATVEFTPNLRRHLEAASARVQGDTVRGVLEAVFDRNPRLRSYILDDQGRLRKHVTVFVDNQRVLDREGLSDPVTAESEIYVLQALSGG